MFSLGESILLTRIIGLGLVSGGVLLASEIFSKNNIQKCLFARQDSQ